jgi:hypothetical protein
MRFEAQSRNRPERVGRVVVCRADQPFQIGTAITGSAKRRDDLVLAHGAVRDVVAEERARLAHWITVGRQRDVEIEAAQAIQLHQVAPEIALDRIDQDRAHARDHVADDGDAKRRLVQTKVARCVTWSEQNLPTLRPELHDITVLQRARYGRIDARRRFGVGPQRQA